MEQTRINHSPLITAIENFVEDIINRTEPWDGYWSGLGDLLKELQDQYNPDLRYSAYNEAYDRTHVGIRTKFGIRCYR
jgi:hypothetical protein